MTRGLRIRMIGLTALAWWALARPAPALAQQPGRPATGGPPPTGQDPATGSEPKTKEQLEAQQHFQRAKDLYQTGSYREAIAELELARSLDPTAKDLIFNLGIVHEKLAKYDEAITYFRQYLEMASVTAAERAKAETIIKRIEGAKREVAPSEPKSASSGAAAPAADAAANPAASTPARAGRIDAATIAAGSVMVVGLGVGTAFGLLALANRPATNGFTTGRDGTYDALKAKADDAHVQAVVADVGFAVGLAAGALTAYLYFGRPREPKPSALSRLVPTVAPLSANGAILTLSGAFR